MNNKYRFKIWYQLMNFVITWSILGMLAGAVLAIIIAIPLLIFAVREGQIGMVIFLIIFCSLAGFSGILLMLLIVVLLGNAWLSYLRVDSTGLEMRIWPSYHLRCHWHQIIGLEHVTILGGLLVLPMLRFKEARIKSWRATKWYIRLGRNGLQNEFVDYPESFRLGFLALFLWSVEDKRLIPVYIFNGWPDGQLKRDLETRLGPISSK